MMLWRTEALALKTATFDNACIPGPSGPRKPAAAGKLGVIETGGTIRGNAPEG